MQQALDWLQCKPARSTEERESPFDRLQDGQVEQTQDFQPGDLCMSRVIPSESWLISVLLQTNTSYLTNVVILGKKH